LQVFRAPLHRRDLTLYARWLCEPSQGSRALDDSTEVNDRAVLFINCWRGSQGNVVQPPSDGVQTLLSLALRRPHG
jgi:hypothetical protein